MATQRKDKFSMFISLNISEELLDAPQEIRCCFHYINIYANVYAINIVICLMLIKFIELYCCIV